MKKLWLCLWMCLFVAAVGFAELEEDEYEAYDDEEAVEVFDRNIRLDVQLRPLEEGDEGVFITTASSWYHTSVRYEGDEGAIEFQIGGHIELLDDGRVFLTYESYGLMAGEEEEAEFNMESSVLLTFGKSAEVARVGEKTLVITVTQVGPQTEE